MNLRTLVCAATVASGLIASSAFAATVTNDGYRFDPDPTPFNLEAHTLTVGGSSVSPSLSNSLDIGTNLSGELNNGTNTSGGSIAFQFVSAVAGLFGVNTSTSNTAGSYTDLRISWCDSVAASGCVGENAFIVEPISGENLVTLFDDIGTEKWLYASWSGVASQNENLDFRVVSQIPVPAAGILLLTAIGGAAALRRRKKAIAA